MANFRRVYPPKESILFDGGLNNKYSRSLIPENESPDCKNVIFDDGAVATRDGIKKLNTTAVDGGSRFNGLYTRRANDGTETMVAFCGTDAFYLNVTTFITIPSAQGVFQVGNRVAAEMAENKMFFGASGTSVGYKYDGTYFTRHGVDAPTQTMVVSADSGANLTGGGSYRWAVSYVNSALVEGDLSPFTSTFVVSASSSNAYLTNVPVAPVSYGVAARKIYRNANADQTIFKLVGTIANNTATTFQDTVADASLGATAPDDNGTPPNYNAIIYHRNRLFVNDINNKNYVWFSEINNPYTFPSTNFFRVGDNSSDLVKGFSIYEDHLIVFCEKSVFINYMPDPSDDGTWRQLKTNSYFGSKSPYSFIPITLGGDNVVMYPATEAGGNFLGFAAIKGANVDPTSTNLTVSAAGSDLQSDKIEPDMFQIQNGFVENISGIAFKNKAYISVPYGNTSVNNRIYCVDFSPSNLKKQQKVSFVPFTGMSIEQMTIYDGKLYGASSLSDGYVYQLVETGVYSDDGQAIDSYYWTKEFSGYQEDTNFFKDFRYINLLVDAAGSYNMEVHFRSDSEMNEGESTLIDLTNGTQLWGTIVYGVDEWGAGIDQLENRTFLGQTRGKRIQYKFSNQNIAGQYFKVHRANFSYNVKGFR